MWSFGTFEAQEKGSVGGDQTLNIVGLSEHDQFSYAATPAEYIACPQEPSILDIYSITLNHVSLLYTCINSLLAP